jgi:hypothetical protein
MSIEDFIICVYCCVVENRWVLREGKRLRQRGFKPQLSDQEVITIEIVGESLGISKDRKFNRMCLIIRVSACPTDPFGTAPLLRVDTPSLVVLSEMGL